LKLCLQSRRSNVAHQRRGDVTFRRRNFVSFYTGRATSKSV